MHQQQPYSRRSRTGGGAVHSILAPRTGIITQLGTDMVNGFQMYLDEHDGKLGGATVKFIVEDDKGTVDGDVSMAKKLILQDKADIMRDL